MKFTLQSDAAANLVVSCTASRVVLRDRAIVRSAIITRERVVADWPPRNVATLDIGHLRAALELRPEMILLGTGERQQFPESQLIAAAQSAGVGFEVMDTRAACRTYNVLLQEERRVALAVLIESREPHASQ